MIRQPITIVQILPDTTRDKTSGRKQNLPVLGCLDSQSTVRSLQCRSLYGSWQYLVQSVEDNIEQARAARHLQRIYLHAKFEYSELAAPDRKAACMQE